MNDDLIRRNDALDALNQCDDIRGYAYRQMHDALTEIPSAEKQGKWIYPTEIIGFGRCSNCKALWDKSLIDNRFFLHCPRCGARMKGADDEMR